MGTDVARYVFGPFTLDTRSLELIRSGERVPLTPQPAKILALLVARRGELVTRNEIREHVWGEQAVDFDAGLHSCIRAIRRALEDEAQAPSYIETIPRRGYRFIARLESPAAEVRPALSVRRWPRLTLVSGAVLALVAIAALAVLRFGVASDPDHVGPSALRLVVMPFDNELDADDLEAAFARALDEEIRTELSRLDPERLGVIARTSSRLLRQREASLPEIREQLDATHILEGTVRRVGGKLSITAQLVRVDDEVQIWAERFPGTPQRAGVVMDVAQQVTRNLVPELLPALRRKHSSPRAVPDEARRAVLEAGHLLREWRQEPATVRLREAVALAPQYAEAHALLAEASALDARWDDAESAARLALQLDDQLPRAARVLGDVELYGRLRVGAAGHWYEQAAKLAPTDPEILMSRAWWWVTRGDTDRAIDGLRAALRWDPVSPLIHGDAPWFYFYARRFDEAVAESRRNLELLPDLSSALQCQLAVALVRRDEKEVARLARSIRAGVPHKGTEAVASDFAFDEMLRRNIDALSTGNAPNRNSRLARMHALLGEGDLALASLERAVEARESDLLFVAVDPHYDDLRDRPRFAAILEAIASVGRKQENEQGA